MAWQLVPTRHLHLAPVLHHAGQVLKLHLVQLYAHCALQWLHGVEVSVSFCVVVAQFVPALYRHLDPVPHEAVQVVGA